MGLIVYAAKYFNGDGYILDNWTQLHNIESRARILMWNDLCKVSCNFTKYSA